MNLKNQLKNFKIFITGGGGGVTIDIQKKNS